MPASGSPLEAALKTWQALENLKDLSLLSGVAAFRAPGLSSLRMVLAIERGVDPWPATSRYGCLPMLG